MIPNNQTNTNGCVPTSSNCVIWQGPDISCINICAGATISDVVAQLAEEIGCTATQAKSAIVSGSTRSGGTSADSIDINSLVQKCIATDNGRDAENVQELLQWIIDKICGDSATGSTRSGGSQDPCEFATSCTLPLPECTQYEIGGTVNKSGTRVGGTKVTSEVLYDASTNSGWIVTVGNYICGLWGAMVTVNSRLDNHETRIKKLEDGLGGTTIGGTSTVTTKTVDANGNLVQQTGTGARSRALRSKTGVEEVVARYLRSGQVTAGSLALTIEKELFTLRAAIGTSTNIRQAIQYQQQSLGTLNRLNGAGTMMSLQGFNGSARTLADSFKNLWLTTNDIRQAVVNLQDLTTPTACSEVTFAFEAGIQHKTDGSFEYLFIDFTKSSIPKGWRDCGAGNSTTVTVTDSSLNVRTYAVDVSGKFQNAKLPYRITDLGGIDITSNLVVKVDFCVSSEGSQCGETISTTVQNTSPCPKLSSSSSTADRITFAYQGINLKTGKEAMVTVNLLNSVGSVVQTRTFTNWGSMVSGNFTGLNAGTAYQLQLIQKSQTGHINTCPSSLMNTAAPSCIMKSILSANYSVTATDQVAGSNSMEIAQWDDGGTVSLWTATFNSGNQPIIIKTNPTTSPTTAWTHQGEFVSDNPTDPITCGTTTFTATGMRTNMANVGYEQSGWKYIGALTDPSTNIFYVYALINSETHSVTEVVFCCDCKQTSIVLDNHYGMYYCVTAGVSQIKINVVGDTSSSKITPVWQVVNAPYNGTVQYDTGSSTTSQGVFNYTNNVPSGGSWTADSFTVRYTGSCGTTSILTVPIIKAIPLTYRDEDIVVYVDTTVYSSAEADGIKATFNAMKVNLAADCSWTGSMYFVALAAGAVAHTKEPGDYIKHSRSLIDSHNGGTTTSITLNTTGTWNAWNDLPDWWTASSGAWKSSITVFSFVGQGNAEGNYASALLANGWTTPTQPTAGSATDIANATYKEDIDAMMDFFSSTAPRSNWSTAETAGGKEWKAGSIPFRLKQFIINKNDTTIGASAANLLQIMSAVSDNTAHINAREFYGYKTGNINYPVDVSSYLLAGTATAPNPYNTNSTGSVPIKGLENFNVVPHFYFDAGNNGGGSADWGTTNSEIKKAFLGMLGHTEGLLTNCPATSGYPRMGGSATFAFRASTGSVGPDQAATCLLAQTPGNCTVLIWNGTGDIMDADVKAYISQSGATLAQSEYELPAGYYAQCPGTSGAGSQVGEYVPAGGAGNYWRNITTCP